MMKNTSPQRSRKAAQGREGSVSTKTSRQAQLSKQAQSARGAAGEKRYDLIALGVDTHAAQYSFGRKIEQQGIQPTQKLAPAAFLELLKKQLLLAKRVVMVYEA